jgi:hypothetical protein
MARSGRDWADLQLLDDVGLLLGWRRGRRELEGRPMPVDGDVAAVMLDNANRTLAGMADREGRPYAGVPALEQGQFLHVDVAELPSGPHAAELENSEAEEVQAAADVIDLVSQMDAGQLPELTADEVRGRQWLFYAVVVRQVPNSEPLAFVRQWNPQRGMGAGRLTTRLANRLVKLDDPLFIFDLQCDVIIAHDEVAILNLTSFDRVFADLDPTGAEVPHHLEAIDTKLAAKLDAAASARVEAVCRTKPGLARRLRRVARASHLAQVTRAALDDALQRHGFPGGRFGTDDQIALGDDKDVAILLDMLEELYFEGDFSGEHRRADRYSPRL